MSIMWSSIDWCGCALNDGVNSQRAIAKGMAFVPGTPFYANNPDGAALRLSFATADIEKIAEGVERLGQARKVIHPKSHDAHTVHVNRTQLPLAYQYPESVIINSPIDFPSRIT